MDEKKKDLIPVAAIALFLIIIIILCAVRLTQRRNEAETQPSAAAESGIAESGTLTEPANTKEGMAWLTQTEDVSYRQAPAKKNTADQAKEAAEETQKSSESLSIKTQKQPTENSSDTDGLASIPEGWVIPAGSVSCNNPYAGAEGVDKTNEEMLAEMADYWQQNRMDAVSDLAQLAWFRQMSDSITGQDTFYYYGERNGFGQPHGTGIAVYADHEYYYGEWQNGKRQGQGEWFKKYVYYDNDAVSDRAYQVHMYMGEWADNLPNGIGQEHVDLDMGQAAGQQRYVQNVIGTFRDGYYSGEMYLTTLSRDGKIEEWNGFADDGIWSPFGSGTDRLEIPVCQNVTDENAYLWMAVRENKDRGIGSLTE